MPESETPEGGSQSTPPRPWKIAFAVTLVLVGVVGYSWSYAAKSPPVVLVLPAVILFAGGLWLLLSLKQSEAVLARFVTVTGLSLAAAAIPYITNSGDTGERALPSPSEPTSIAMVSPAPANLVPRFVEIRAVPRCVYVRIKDPIPAGYTVLVFDRSVDQRNRSEGPGYFDFLGPARSLPDGGFGVKDVKIGDGQAAGFRVEIAGAVLQDDAAARFMADHEIQAGLNVSLPADWQRMKSLFVERTDSDGDCGTAKIPDRSSSLSLASLPAEAGDHEWTVGSVEIRGNLYRDSISRRVYCNTSYERSYRIPGKYSYLTGSIGATDDSGADELRLGIYADGRRKLEKAVHARSIVSIGRVDIGGAREVTFRVQGCVVSYGTVVLAGLRVAG